MGLENEGWVGSIPNFLKFNALLKGILSELWRGTGISPDTIFSVKLGLWQGFEVFPAQVPTGGQSPYQAAVDWVIEWMNEWSNK